MNNTTNLANTIASIENRIHILEVKDPVRNHAIIAKLRRRLRKLTN